MNPLTALLCVGLSVGTGAMKAGTLPRPTLWAEPGSVIPWGHPVTLCCQGSLGGEEFRLYKEGSSLPWARQSLPEPGNKTKFPLSSMVEHYAGIYQCFYHRPAGWSYPSKPLELVVTGTYSKPFLSVHQGPIVISGGMVTLRCGSQLGFYGFILTQDGESKTVRTFSSQPNPSGQYQALFSVGPVIPRHNWTFRCYGFYRNKTQVWSHPSNSMQLWISGEYNYIPTLSVQPGPTVSPGENVNLLCHSGGHGDTFLLVKEGTDEPLLRVPAETRDRFAPGRFSFHPMTSAHGGTYRCYSSYHDTPYLLSHPSAPLQLQVSGAAPATIPSQTEADTIRAPASQPRDYTVENLLRLGVACFLLLVLGILLLEAWHSRGDAEAALPLARGNVGPVWRAPTLALPPGVAPSAPTDS